VDIDREICARDEWFSKISRGYRRRCITTNIVAYGYVIHSTGNRGKKTYRLDGDRDTLRTKLASISTGGL